MENQPKKEGIDKLSTEELNKVLDEEDKQFKERQYKFRIQETLDKHQKNIVGSF